MQEFPNLDFSAIPSDYNSKQGFWSDDEAALRNRAAKVRIFCTLNFPGKF